MKCSICQKAQQDNFRKFKCLGIDYVEQCQTGEVPKLSKANQGFWFLFQRILPRLYDGFGGVNPMAISQIFDLYHVPDGERPILDDKCLTVISVIHEIRALEKEQEKQQNA